MLPCRKRNKMKQLNIMKKIDTAIFSKLDQLQKHPEFQKVADAYSALEERYQEMIKISMALLIILVPVLTLSIFSLINTSAMEDLKLKEEIITYANEIIQKQSLLNKEERDLLGRTFIDSQRSLQQKITSNMSRLGIDTSKVKISNFDAIDLSGNILQAQLDVKFDGFTNDQVFGLLSTLISKEKMRIDSFTAKKNKNSNMLDGIFTILYFSKDAGEGGE
jgi:hypothetical protein